MHLRDLFRAKKPVVSFEIFSPQAGHPGGGDLRHPGGHPGPEPDFVSVTYGAGGSTKNLTREIASTVKNRFGLEVMAHFTGLSHPPAEVDDMAGGPDGGGDLQRPGHEGGSPPGRGDA